MTDAFIYDHIRSPRGRGKPDGALHAITPIDLVTQVLASLQDRNNLDTSLVDDVVLGCVTPVGEQGADIARTAVLNADYAECVPGTQINRFCASGLEAVNIAAAQVMSGHSDVTIGGGIESMSRVQMMSDGGAWATDPQVAYKTYFVPQGVSADLLATKHGFSRDDLDLYSLSSQQRAAQAWQEGWFKDSILPIKDHLGRVILDQDEHVRSEITVEDLSNLKPAFTVMGEQGGFDSVILQRYPEVESINHVHTAGNSSGIVDGSAAMLIGNAKARVRMGLRPRARIRTFASVGSEPSIMLTGPVPATEKALRRAGMSTSDIDLFELNEAFAAVVLYYMEALNVPHEKINVNGGAIAMGHPLGATGTMILGTVLDELERRNLSTALISLCVGGGMGTATIIERV